MSKHVVWGLIAGIVLAVATVAVAGKGADTVRTSLKVEGMHCDGCSSAIVGALERVEGVLSASADYKKGQAEVVYRPKDVEPEDLKSAIEKLGYTVVSMETSPADEKQT